MTEAAAAVDVDDEVVDPSNGDCAAVNYRPSATSSASASDPSQLVCSAGGDSTSTRAAAAALSTTDTPRPAAEVTSAAASSAAEEEERKLLFWCLWKTSFVTHMQYVKTKKPFISWWSHDTLKYGPVGLDKFRWIFKTPLPRKKNVSCFLCLCHLTWRPSALTTRPHGQSIAHITQQIISDLSLWRSWWWHVSCQKITCCCRWSEVGSWGFHLLQRPRRQSLIIWRLEHNDRVFCSHPYCKLVLPDLHFLLRSILLFKCYPNITLVKDD